MFFERKIVVDIFIVLVRVGRGAKRGEKIVEVKEWGRKGEILREGNKKKNWVKTNPFMNLQFQENLFFAGILSTNLLWYKQTHHDDIKIEKPFEFNGKI